MFAARTAICIFLQITSIALSVAFLSYTKLESLKEKLPCVLPTLSMEF